MTLPNSATNSASAIEAAETPIFLIGAERSGTTLLRLMLDGHGKITWSHEFEYAVDLLSDAGHWPDLAQYYDWLETHRIFLANQFVIDRRLDYHDLVTSFLQQQRDRHSKPIVGATVHRHFGRLLKLWPKAKLIYLLRDGRDVARSNIGMGWAGNVWTGSQRWLEAETEWQRIKSDLPCEQWIELHYEDLIQHPELELSRLCDFVGVAYEPQMMSYVERTSYSYPDPTRVQQWQEKLSDRQIRLLEARIAPVLDQRGYRLSGLPPLEVSPRLKTYLRLQSWASRATFRLRRYGVRLFVADFLARKLKLTAWQKRVQRVINDRQTQCIKLMDGAGSDSDRKAKHLAEIRQTESLTSSPP